MTKSNYKARRARGQCVGCKKQSETFRCAECKVKYNEYNRAWRACNSAHKRRKLEQINEQLIAQIAELEKKLAEIG